VLAVFGQLSGCTLQRFRISACDHDRVTKLHELASQRPPNTTRPSSHNNAELAIGGFVRRGEQSEFSRDKRGRPKANVRSERSSACNRPIAYDRVRSEPSKRLVHTAMAQVVPNAMAEALLPGFVPVQDTLAWR
jgi:hypothetical protein